MIPYYCPQGHENPPGSRFCLQCGAKLNLPFSKGIYPGLLLGDRYRVVSQLGQGGFGRTYLAEDTNRFSELCVLKEFAPQVQSAYVLQKAEEMFEREAGVLYKLQHPQIPRFRESFRVNLDNKGYLFLVQDYVEGQTYHALLDARRSQGLRFSEAEVIQLLLQILPVLEYIHSMGVIHRDISPDNLILRRSDHLPVLIDFGGVKQVAATVASQFYQPVAGTSSPATLLGKVGYAPHEQIQVGIVDPHSDLYALAATVLVLLTGKEPQELIDDNTLTWNWRREVNLSPTLGAVLDKMLSQRIGDRYPSARQVMQALTGNLAAPTSAPTQLPTPDTEITFTPTPSQPSNRLFTLVGKILLVFLLLASAAGVGWWGANRWLQSRSNLSPQDTITPESTPIPSSTPTVKPQSTPSPQLSTEEQNRKEQLRDRRQQMGIQDKFYVDLVNQVFWDKYPNYKGRTLSNSPKDAALRTEWDTIAAQLLDQLQLLSLEARRRLGSYTAADRERWKVEVNKLHFSSRALYDLTDAAFFEMFPQQRGKKFINQPIAQVWHAIATDKLNPIIAATTFQRIVFDRGASGKVSGTLNPGEGKAYIVRLAKGQLMKLDLQANPKVLLSVYSPTGKTILLEDSSDRAWSGNLPEQGFYEFVVVSTASEPVDYQLKITTENFTSAPSVEPSPPDTPSPSP
jgi:serine/threonine-protein kinase